MASLDGIEDALTIPTAAGLPRESRRHPDGWAPGVDTARGVIVAEPSEDAQPPTDWSHILAQFGLSNDDWEVVDDRVNVRTWDAAIGNGQVRRFYYWRADIRPRRRDSDADCDRLLETIARWRPRVAGAKRTADGSFVLPVGDLQLGKVDGDGSAGTVRRFLSETERQARLLKAATPRGQIQQQVTVAWLGDCIEGVWSQGGSLRMRLDLTPTEQVRVYRRLMWAQIRTFLPLAERLLVSVIPGNHDEALRVGDRMATRYDDSWAVEGAAAVADGCRENPELADRVRFLFPPKDELTMTIDVAGTSIGLAHGHQFGSGVNGWRNWWDAQAGGRTDIGQADMLLAAHLHHLRVQDHGDGRLFVQIPALDGGSTWFRHRQGQASPARTVSFWTAGGQVWGLDPLVTS